MHSKWDYAYHPDYHYRPTGLFFPGLFFVFLLVMLFSWGWFPGLFALFVIWAFAKSGRGFCNANDESDGEKRKNRPYFTDIENGEKPKRDGRYIHTPDGETLEIV